MRQGEGKAKTGLGHRSPGCKKWGLDATGGAEKETEWLLEFLASGEGGESVSPPAPPAPPPPWLFLCLSLLVCACSRGPSRCLWFRGEGESLQCVHILLPGRCQLKGPEFSWSCPLTAEAETRGEPREVTRGPKASASSHPFGRSVCGPQKVSSGREPSTWLPSAICKEDFA